MVIGFCGAGSNFYFSSYYSGKTSGGSSPSAPILLWAGSYPLPGVISRWGDYSYTSVDPEDDENIWTVQSFAKFVTIGRYWDTVIARISP
jgi:hypothetical protein